MNMMKTNPFRNKNFQYGSAAVILVAVVLACIVIFNVLLSLFTAHFGWYADISSSQLFELSDESLSLLDTVDGEKNKVTVYYMADENTLSSTDYGKYVLGLTDSLENRYDFIDVKFFDSIKTNLFEVAAVYGEKKEYAESFEQLYENQGFTQGTMILRNDTYLLDENGEYQLGITGEKQADYRVSTFSITELYSEPTATFIGDFFLTGRIMSICQANKTAYFLSGHGDISTEDDGDFGSSELLADIFSCSGYNVKKHDLTKSDFDADYVKDSVAVIFAPRIDLSAKEIERLSAFVSAGGHVMAFTDGTYYRLDKLTAFLSGYGITVVNAKIQSGVDSSLGDNGFMFAADTAWDSPIFKNLRDREKKMVLSSCRVLSLDETKGAKALLTPPASYAPVGADETKPENAAAVAISEDSSRGSVFVSGSISLASSFMYSSSYNNRNLMLSVLAEMGAENVLLNVDVKNLANDGLDLTKGQASALSLVVAIIPAAIASAIGIVIYVRRKRS